MKYCQACLDPCESTTVDQGFYYEYGSERGYHKELVEVSECCKDDIEEVSDDIRPELAQRYIRRYNQLPQWKH